MAIRPQTGQTETDPRRIALVNLQRKLQLIWRRIEYAERTLPDCEAKTAKIANLWVEYCDLESKEMELLRPGTPLTLRAMIACGEVVVRRTGVVALRPGVAAAMKQRNGGGDETNDNERN